jgi:transposase
MYIRKTNTRKTENGSAYATFRLVCSERIHGRVKQRTILNLGCAFDLPPELWPALCLRLDALLTGQSSFIPETPEVEALARQCAARIIAAKSTDVKPQAQTPQFEEVDVNSLETLRPRSVGVEHVGLYAARLLYLPDIFSSIGFSVSQIQLATASIIGRMAKPGSEKAAWEWLTEESALGELLEVDFSRKSLMGLYRISDQMIIHREAIENQLFSRINDLFSLPRTITLYDLTNTYFEGDMQENQMAKRGFSKEKRSDCPLLTLAVVLDGSGFICRSKVFPGNVSEPATVRQILSDLGAPLSALVVMDRGLATEDNLKYLSENGYRYVVVSRERSRQFDFSRSQALKTAAGQEIEIYREVNDAGSEARLYCYSAKRSAKESAMTRRLIDKFESGLKKLDSGLRKPRTNKRKDTVVSRIGRLTEKCAGIGRHYSITVTDNSAEIKSGEPVLATGILFEQKTVPGSILSQPGVYCLRSNDLSLDAESLWKTYMTLTDLESVFRSLKSELGLRPVYHHKGHRAEGHLFISVLAYQCVQVIRKTLKSKGMHESWQTLRQILSRQRRTTVTFKQRNGNTVHIRNTSAPEEKQQRIYDALKIDPRPGGLKKYSLK